MQGQSVTIELDKVRNVRFEVNDVCKFEERAGVSLEKAANDEPGFLILRLMLWACLSHEDKSLTVQRTGVLMQEHLHKGGKVSDFAEIIKKGMIHAGLGQVEKQDDVAGNAGAGEEVATTPTPEISSESASPNG